MSCEVFEQQISQLIDHELDDTYEAELFSHMGVCSTCREFHHSSLKLRTMLLRSEEGVQAEATTHREDVRQRVLGDSKTSFAFLRRSLTLSRFAAAAIAALMLVVGGIASTVWFQSSSESSQKNVEYIMTYPPIEVKGYLVNESSHQQSERKQ